MFVDEIEFIIAKAKLEVELKFNENQPRDENGRFTDGSGFTGAASFVNPRDDKDVQRYLELKKIANGPYVRYGEPGYEEHRAAVSEYRNTPKHIVDRAKLSINLENKTQRVADGFAAQELGLTPKDVEDQITTELQEFVNENPVAVQIPISRLDSVLDNGLQSMYESGTRGGKRGAEYQEIRADSEAALFGYNDEKTPAEQRPIYGFVARPETSLQWDSVGGYGNTTVILKDSVRDNTTVTVDDSLEMSYTYGDIFPTPISNVTIDSVTTARADIFVRERDIPFADRPFTYVEAQIHGGVEPSDIESVILPKAPTRAMAAKMDGLGITYTVKEQTKSFTLKEWAEELHPRDELGRFTSSGIGSVSMALDTLREISEFYDFKPGQTFGQMASRFRDDTFYGDKVSAAEKYLRDKYQKQGMGRNNAIAQAEADLLRVDGMLKQAENKENYEAYNARILESATANDNAKEYIAHQQEAMALAAKEATDAIENGRVCVAVSEDVIREVIEDGRFKNQFETKTSNGTLNPGMRKVWESVITGAPVDVKPSERAIYGFMATNTLDPKHDSNGEPWEWSGPFTEHDTAGQWTDMKSLNSPMIEMYGEVVVELKDSVRDRTTATIGDSLRAQTTGLPVNEPVTEEGLLVAGLYQRTDRAISPMSVTRYVEAQVTGGVKVEDIARIHVSDPAEFTYISEKYPDIQIVERFTGENTF